jgi:hypothetical protein
MSSCGYSVLLFCVIVVLLQCTVILSTGCGTVLYCTVLYCIFLFLFLSFIFVFFFVKEKGERICDDYCAFGYIYFSNFKIPVVFVVGGGWVVGTRYHLYCTVPHNR